MRRALSWTAAALALLAQAEAAPTAPSVQWTTSLPAALAAARGGRKPVMVEFWADWCGWCHVFERTTFADADVVRLLQDFVPVRIDTEGSAAQAEVAARYGVSGLPTILFLTPSGRMVSQVSGYQGPEQFAHTLHEVRIQAAKVDGWERAIAAHPDDAAALLELGTHALETEALEDGRDLLARARRSDHKLPASDRKRVRLLLGAVRGIERQYVEAEALLTEGLKLRPADPQGDAKLLLALGRLYVSWGKRESAVSTLTRVLREYPDSRAAEQARQVLAYLERPS